MRVLAFVFTALGCSASGPTPPDMTQANACGPAPWVKVHVGVASYTTGKPIVGATGTLDACSGLQLVSDDSGFFDVQITPGLGFDTRVEAAGYIPTRGGQSSVSADLSLGSVALFPLGLMPLFPHLTDSTPVLVAITVLPAGTMPNPADPCTQRDGVTFTVTGHPEAVVTYYGGTPQKPMLDSTLTTTSVVGAAEISGLAATSSPDIQLAVAKPGCEIAFASYPHTGKYALENGVLTLAGAFMPPVPAP